jgi:hypothetical protein
MLLTQKSLTSMYHLLLGKLTLDYDDATMMLVRTYLSTDLDTDGHPWLENEVDNGVPEQEWGILSREGWLIDGERLEPAIDMVMMEAIRRDLDPQKHLLDWSLYGFFDSHKMENIPAPRKWRRDKKIHVPSEPWPLEQARKNVIGKLDRKIGAVQMKMDINRSRIALIETMYGGLESNFMGHAVIVLFKNPKESFDTTMGG